MEANGGQCVNIGDLQALYFVVDNNKAMMDGLIAMKPSGTTEAREFRASVAEAGDVQVGAGYVSQNANGKRFRDVGRREIRYAMGGWARPRQPQLRLGERT